MLFSPYCFFERNFGAAVRTYYLWLSLSKKFNVLSVELGERDIMRRQNQFVFRYDRRNFFPNAIKLSFKLRNLILKNKISLIIFSTSSIHTSLILIFLRLLLPKIKIIIDAHNIEYLVQKFKRGYFAAMFTFFLEKLAFNIADIIFSVSEKDKKLIRRLTKKKIEVFPNGVDVRVFIGSKKCSYLKNFKPLLVFHGLIGYKPNEEAVKFLVDILSILRRKIFNLHLLIFGPGSEKINGDGIISLGELSFKEIPRILRTCDIAALPIFHGSGTRLKVLEYMAAGIPFVATRKAVEGIDLESPKNFLLAEKRNEFVNSIVKLLRNKHLARNIRRNNLLHVKKYDWKRIWNLNRLTKLICYTSNY